MLGWDAYRGQLGLNGVNFAIRTTGLLALLLLLLSLAITPIRRLTGWNALIALRRTLGLSAALYLCVHFAIFFWFDRAASIRDTTHEILVRRYLQIGAISLGLMMLLAVTSIGAVVTRLGARRWKRLHRLVYVAAILGSIHYCLLVKADLRQPLAFAVILGGLLGFRVIQYGIDRRKTRPTHGSLSRAPRGPRFWSGELQVMRIVEETPDVRTFRLGPKEGGKLPFPYRPGQYLNLALTIDGVRVNRSYTIASSPAQPSFCELTVKRKADGYVSKYLHDVLRAGDTLKVSAAFGRFVFTGAEANEVLLIAGGVGVTPVMSILRYLADCSWPGQIHFLFSVRQRRDVIFSSEIKSLQSRFANLHVYVTLSDGTDGSWAGERGRITGEMLRRLIPNLKNLPVYLCGPDPMMTGTRAVLLELGVSEGQIKMEAFTATGPAIATPRGPAEDSLRPEGGIGGESSGLVGRSLPTVHFRRSGKVAELATGLSILEAAEDAGLEIPFECRSGICGQCKTKLLEGQVTMDVEDALSAADKSNGIILACQAHSARDVAVDA